MVTRAIRVYIALGAVLVIFAIIPCIAAKHLRRYRLGDFVEQNADFKLKFTRYIYMTFQKRNSIIYRYGSLTKEKSNLAVLSKIVDDVMQEYGLSPVPIAIHLRLGDVIDNHDQSVQDILDNGQKREEKRFRCTDKSCTSEGYVQPLSHYHKFASMRPQSINLISGSHMKTNDPSKSQLYIQAIQQYLQSNGHTVTVSWNRDPDIDFAILATAGTLTISGGNFSRIAQAVNTYKKTNGQ